MEQEEVQPETGGGSPIQEETGGTGFSGNAGAGQTGGLESGAESCGCEHESLTAPMDGGPVGVQGAAMGQTEAQVQYQQPPQVQPQPQYQPQQVYSAPPFPPQQPQQGQYSPQYPPSGNPGMMPPQGSYMSPQMNPAASGQDCGHMGAGAKHVEHDENRFGQMADMVGRFVQGEVSTNDMVKGLLSLNFRDDQFWKGALAGAVAALVLNSDMVKQGVGKIFAGVSSKAVESSETPKEAVKKAETTAKTKKSK